MKQQTNVSQGIADFGAFVKAEAAYDAIADSEASQNFFERSRLCDRAVENRDARVRIVTHDGCNLTADEFRFGGSVGRLEESQFAACAQSGLKSLPQAIGIVFHDCGSRIQNRLRGAVIFFQADELGVREVFGEAFQVSSARATPSIDCLLYTSPAYASRWRTRRGPAPVFPARRTSHRESFHSAARRRRREAPCV